MIRAELCVDRLGSAVPPKGLLFVTLLDTAATVARRSLSNWRGAGEDGHYHFLLCWVL
jgi:hypothetical protein